MCTEQEAYSLRIGDRVLVSWGAYAGWKGTIVNRWTSALFGQILMFRIRTKHGCVSLRREFITLDKPVAIQCRLKEC